MSTLAPAAGASDIFRGAANTINRAVTNVSQDAAVVASAAAGGDTGDLLAALLNSRQQLMYTQAGARMMETASQMLGSLLDVRA